MQNKAEEIIAMEPGKLIELLKNPEATEFAKAKACQRLAVLGTKDAVPALVALLNDKHLGEYARYGLEPIPDPSVDDALRAALAKLKGRPQVGVINSIGFRKDVKAIETLARLMGDSDIEVAEAAAAALGRIGNPQAAKKLQKMLGRSDAPVRREAANAGLVCAENLLRHGDRKQALSLYAALERKGLPEPVRSSAARSRKAAL